MARRVDPKDDNGTDSPTSGGSSSGNPRPKSQQPTKLGTDRVFQSSERGVALPIAYGTVKITPQVLERYDSLAVVSTAPNWTPDTDYLVLGNPVRSQGNTYVLITAGHSSTTGTLGNGPGGTGTDIVDGTAHWKYIPPGFYTAVLLGFCEGPAYGALKAWQDSLFFTDYSQLVAVSANYQLFLGTSAGVTKPAWFPAGSDPLPDSYSNTAVLFINGSAGADATVPNISLEIQSIFADATHVDASPADIAIDLLTHARRGAGWASTRVDSVSTGSGAASWRTYCTAYGLNLSWLIDQQAPALALLGLLLDATNSDAVWTNRPDGAGGMLRFVPRGDQALTANGVTFTPNTTPAYSIGPDDLLAPIEIQRVAPIDTYNSCPIEYVDRASGYLRTTVDDPDMSDVDSRGLARAQTSTLPQVIAPEAAIMLSRIRAQRSLACRNTYTLRLPWRFLLLEPTDLLTISDPVLGLSNLPVRVTAIEEDQGGSGSFTVQAEDWPGAVHVATAYASQTGDGYRPNQGTALARLAVLPAQIVAGTVSDAGSTRGGSVDNIFPNPTSEASPPDGANTATAEWAGRVNDTGAVAGTFVRQLSAVLNARQLLGDATKFVDVSGGYPVAGFVRPTYQSQLAFIVPCSPGESFYMEAQARFTAGANGEGAGVYMYFLDSAGKGVTQPAVTFAAVACGASVPTAWTKATASATAPAGSTAVYFFCYANSDLGAVTAQFDAIYARRQIDPGVLTSPVFSANASSNFTTTNLAYTKDHVGMVRFRGYVDCTVASPTLFTLPAGLRPINTRLFIVSNGSNATPGQVQVSAAGVVFVNDIGAINPTVGNRYFMDQVMFAAEQ